MASRPSWKGVVSFGMVVVPIKLYTATEDKDIHLNSIHRNCNTRIQMPKFCPTCQKAVPANELVKGYEVGDGQYVLLEEADMAALPLKSLKTIDVVEFVDGSRIDPRHFEKSYFIAPDDAGVKAFSLFLQAMTKTGLVGIAKLGLRDKEHLAVIRAFGKVILLQTLFWADELKSVSEFERSLPECSEKELQMAITLMNTLKTDDIDLGKYQNQYRDALLQVVQAKLSGQPITVQAIAQEKPMDLVDALMASINKAKEPAGVK